MANLKEVKNRITSVTSTQQITKAMKMVAAAKLRRAQDRVLQLRPYARQLERIIQDVSSLSEDVDIENIFGTERAVNNVLLVIISSDRGLCGAFNGNVFKFASNHIKKFYGYLECSGNLHVMPIGKRALDYFTKRNYKVIGRYAGLFNELTYDSSNKASNYVMEGFQLNAYDKVEIIFNEFKNVATQNLKIEQLIPVPRTDISTKTSVDYIFEPSREKIINKIIPKSIRTKFYKALLESNASEQGARMTAMDKATENAGELLKELKLTYNRTRQAAITKEILEIVGGAEALSQS